MVTEWRRRTVLAGMSAMAIANNALGAEGRAFSVPDGACDCHLHLYDPRFPYLAEARLKPPPATASDYRKVQAVLGTTRCVVVNPSTYGADNSCTIDALQQLGDAARGVIMCPVNLPQSELKRFDDAGVRGVRISGSSIVAKDEILPLARRIANLGWHIQLSFSPEYYVELQDILPLIPTPIVIDHFGQVRMPEDGKSAHYQLMRRLLDSGNAWMKLASPYTNSKSGPPGFADIAVLARDYISRAPERMLWATNWPYPEVSVPPRPDNLNMLNQLLDWAPNPNVRHRILVENPEAIYGFSPMRRPQSSKAGKA